jgi:hypothetical protein
MEKGNAYATRLLRVHSKAGGESTRLPEKPVFRNFKMVKSNPGSEGDCPIDWGWVPTSVFVYPPITRTELQPNIKNIHAVDLNGYVGAAILIAFE